MLPLLNFGIFLNFDIEFIYNGLKQPKNGQDHVVLLNFQYLFAPFSLSSCSASYIVDKFNEQKFWQA